MKFYPISSSVHQPYSHIQPDELPSVLFERTMNMEGLQKEFTKILLLPKKKRDKWITGHKEMILDMLYQIRQEGQIVVRNMEMNEVTKRTIVDYMVVLQNIVDTLERMMRETDQPVD